MEKSELKESIAKAFHRVTLETGVSLRQAEARDDYGSAMSEEEYRGYHSPSRSPTGGY